MPVLGISRQVDPRICNRQLRHRFRSALESQHSLRSDLLTSPGMGDQPIWGAESEQTSAEFLSTTQPPTIFRRITFQPKTPGSGSGLILKWPGQRYSATSKQIFLETNRGMFLCQA